ncbi:WD repeat-containing protein [Pleomassaria siparia CBS 279.74]|uniref:DNA damage-binding protein CMR1 n=1 Tax=Pleomassaria siparia CBS 279.74 TaxID=1314801 RepID=A0A6G1KFH4_9PLEO|nr:WD repeat-containing protein [Pleomassaria siparia CBS 279.74]
MAKQKVELSEYERKRQENIAKTQELLRNLEMEAAQAGLAPTSRSTASSRPKSKPKKPAPKKIKEEDVGPRRTSSRLRGIEADSETAKRKAEEEYDARKEADRAKRQRVSDAFRFSDIVVAGNEWDQDGKFASIVPPAKPYQRTFNADRVKETSDKELKALRQNMMGLQLWETYGPNQIKLTPERIYSMGFHPTADKPLVFAGDKLGNLGIIDCSQEALKAEDDEEADDEGPSITTLKPHTRTIHTFQFSPHDANALYSASYDSTVRKLDLAKGVAIEVYAPADTREDAPLSGIEISKDDANMLYFSTLDGKFGMYDMRTPSEKAAGLEIFQLSDKKIGGFTLHPELPHLVATASLDRTLKIWDLRKIGGKGDSRLPALVGEHESRLSVSHAAWSSAGYVATASYDDTIKIHDFSNSGKWKAGSSLTDAEMKPSAVIPHNNQTGRWVTILRAQWQLYPQDGVQRFCIGNMNRFVDIYTAKGQQLAQLGGEGITAVPAVAKFHNTQDWVAAGTASGKLCLWM